MQKIIESKEWLIQTIEPPNPVHKFICSTIRAQKSCGTIDE